MGGVKREFFDHEAKINKASSLCRETGALRECEVHDGELIDTLEYLDPVELTDKILENDSSAINDFADKDEMIECIREVMTSTGEECGYCANNRDS